MSNDSFSYCDFRPGLMLPIAEEGPAGPQYPCLADTVGAVCPEGKKVSTHYLWHYYI